MSRARRIKRCCCRRRDIRPGGRISSTSTSTGFTADLGARRAARGCSRFGAWTPRASERTSTRCALVFPSHALRASLTSDGISSSSSPPSPSPQVRRVHALCFPEEAPETSGPEPDDAFWDRLTTCHDEDDVSWFLLLDDAAPSSPHIHPSSSSPPVPVVGFAAATRYAKSVYGMHLAVDPAHRGRGHGAWLMREVQAWAIDQGRPQIQATVEASREPLLRYYRGLGARVVPTGVAGAGAAPATVVRIARDVDPKTARDELEASRARGRDGGGGNASERWRRTATRFFAKAAAAAAATRRPSSTTTAAAAAAAAAAVFALWFARRRAPPYPAGFTV